MSDENTDLEPADAGDVDSGNATDPSSPQAKEPRVVEIHGKKFDISTPEGLLQAQAVYDVMSSVIGRQGNELGTLRKFAKEGVTKPKSEIAAAAKAKAAEGDIEGALDAVLAFAEQAEHKAERKLAAEKQNSKAWDAYLDSRKDLAEVFGRNTVREVGEAALGDALYEAEDPFRLIDEYWLPKLPKVLGTTSAPTEKREKPPVALSGGAGRPASTVSSPAPTATPEDDFMKILDSRRVRSNKRQAK